MNATIPQSAIDKFEIEYLATHGGGVPDCLKGRNADEIAAHLRGVGFRIKECFTADGEWLRTTSGISVSLMHDALMGFVFANKRTKQKGDAYDYASRARGNATC